MKKLLLILSLFIAVTFSFQQCKAQVNHLFWAHNNNEFAGYGLLYNWYAASDANFAPAGWHVPTDAETKTLEMYLGMSQVQADAENLRGTTEGQQLKEIGIIHWGTGNTGTNTSGFTAVGSGERLSDGSFSSIKSSFSMISSTSTNISYFVYRQLLTNENRINRQLYGDKKRGMSVRLIKDDSTDPGTLTDYDGNVYKTVKIGDQVFIASNFKCLHLNDGTEIPNVTDNTTWSGLTTGAWCYYNNNSKYK